MQIALRKIYLDNLTSYDENITKLFEMVEKALITLQSDHMLNKL